MNSKIIYAIAAVILLVAIGVVGYKWRKPTTEPASQNITQNNSQDNQQPEQQQPKTADVCSGASTKQPFTPVIDIKNKTAVLDTSMGTIEAQLYDKDAPMTVQNFVCLIQKGYYDGITFHRVAHNFVVQAGDPTGTGSGGDSIYGGPFADELNPNAPSYKAGYVKGVLAMANAGPNTNTSQFFILTADHPELPHNYTIFGKVTVGMDVVDKIGSVPVKPGVFGPDDGAPLTPITINRASIK